MVYGSTFKVIRRTTLSFRSRIGLVSKTIIPIIRTIDGTPIGVFIGSPETLRLFPGSTSFLHSIGPFCNRSNFFIHAENGRVFVNSVIPANTEGNLCGLLRGGASVV